MFYILNISTKQELINKCYTSGFKEQYDADLVKTININLFNNLLPRIEDELLTLHHRPFVSMIIEDQGN